jgi:hypothetical protein
MSYEFTRYAGGLGTNGKTGVTLGPGVAVPPEPPPSGPVTSAQIDTFWQQRQQYEQGLEQQRAEEQSRQAASWAQRYEAWSRQCQAQPEQCAASMVPLCAFASLIPGAIIGAIASPKGERWGGAKWGALASAATCPLGIPTARLGAIGSLIRWSASIAAPVIAARYRLKHKRTS